MFITEPVITDIEDMDNNDFNKPSDDTPNYYTGGVPHPTTQPPNPYLNQAYPPQPYNNAPQQPNQPYTNNPYQQFNNPQMVNGQIVPTAPVAPAKSAVVSIIVSLVTLMFLWVIPVLDIVAAIVGIVYGHKALKETKDSYNSGRGMAIAGVICGYAALAFSVLWTLFIPFMILGMAASSTAP